MPANVDHVADESGAELYRLFGIYGDVIPDFVKKADTEKVLRPGRLPVTIYADPVRHQFPCHNAASTFLSALFYHEKRAEFHPKDQAKIEARLDHYVDYWAIRGTVDRLKEARERLHKEASDGLPDSAYAYVWTAEDGTKERYLRVTTAAEVKAAADFLAANVARMPYEDRQVVASRILNKAAALGWGFPAEETAFLERQAGRGVCDPDRVAGMIRDRAKLARDAALKSQIVGLAEKVASSPALFLDPGTLVKLAATVYDVDRGLNIRPDGYGPLLPRPEDVIFSATLTKAASDVERHVATTSGKVYSKEALAKLSLDELRGVFGDDFADEVRSARDDVDPEKMAEVVATLPRPEAEMLDRLLSENGVQPAMRKAASVKEGFSRQQLAAIARHYKG